MAMAVDLLELARHLKQERLFATSERDQLQTLFDDVKKVAEDLSHESWIAKQQRICLDSLIFNPQNVTTKDCYGKSNLLETTTFVDSYKHLSYHDSKFGDFLKFLKENPRLLAHCIVNGEKTSNENTKKFILSIISAIYGNLVLQDDEVLALQMMRTLIELQLATNDDPRRLLRKGSCAFSVTSRQIFDSLFSAKLFLTAALHEPVMRLLMEDEWFYDIDSQKALVRFPPNERAKRFGEPGTENYKTKCQEYRKFIVDKLVVLTNRFITSIKNNMHCFPSGLGWLVSQVYQILLKTEKIEMIKVKAICADLVFALFMCPAICDPEPHGITSDIFISHIARHNLMQIAQIIQILAVSQWEEDSKDRDLYERFEKGCISSLLDALLDGMGHELPSVSSSNHVTNPSRTSVLLTLPQLQELVTFLQSVVSNIDENVTEKKQLEELLTGLSSTILSVSTNVSQNTPTPTPTQTPPGTPAGQKKQLFKGSKKKLALTPSTQNNVDETPSPSPSESDQQVNSSNVDEVLVISLGTDIECPGMMTEQKVLSWEQENKRRRVKYNPVSSYEVGVGTSEIHEKRTRFSLSQDQESIDLSLTGNTSDIQEAISEAASSHSVGSVDLENDDDNDDNFSDMISANVSGRGTPNISGRDTPLSQAEDVEEVPPPPPSLPDTVQKTDRVDVTDRFGKFEIKSELERDETKSTVSDTWSTDVLASDSEPPEQNQMDRLDEIAEEYVRQSLLSRNEQISEISETASDAWSTDVLASDTDEKQCEVLSEFDQDDIGSVTDLGSISGDTASSIGQEIKDEGHQSPTLQENLDNLGAVGGDNSGAVGGDNPDQAPIFTGNVMSKFIPMRKNSAPKTNVVVDNVFADEESPILTKQKPSEPGDEVNRLSIPVKRLYKGSHSRKHYLSVPEPGSKTVLHPVQHEKPTPHERTTSDSLAFENPVFNGGARPKNPQRSTFPLCNYQQEVETRNKSGSVLESTEATKSMDSGVSDLDCFSDGRDSADLKLTEQQNSNLDVKRLSASLSMFDPISTEHNEENSKGNKTENLDRILGSIPGENGVLKSASHVLNAVTHKNNKDSNRPSDEPLISVSDNKNNTSGVSGNLITHKRSISEGNSRLVHSNGDLHTKLKDRRDSSTSSRSSSGSGNTSDGVPFAKSSRSTSFDNVSQKLDEKEGEDGESEDPKGHHKTKGFFKTFKDKIHKGMKNKKGHKLEKEYSGDGSLMNNSSPEKDANESSDDILAKYRKKPGILSTPPSAVEPLGDVDLSILKEKRRLSVKEESDIQPAYDPNNLENCFAFVDAKRKLRLVLSTGDFQIGYSSVDLFFSGMPVSPRESDNRKESNDLIKLLRGQLAEAINLQNKDLIAQLHEAIRCVRMFDADGCKKLVRSLQDDYQSRSAYISYLIRCRQGLLTTLSHLQRLLNRIQRDKEVCNKHMTSVCVKTFIEKKERNVVAFMAEFQKLTLSDEKTDLVERFLEYLYQQIGQDMIFQAATDSQTDDAKLAIERYIMSRIYTHAMFPNGDGDVMRDQLIHQHIKKLSLIITPAHKDLRIPKMYHFECPWTAAQKEIYMINVYKTPKDKLQCVMRCSATIMNLLSMANEKSVPAADDFMPVFIYVLIKANPPCLLSTIQYVNSFYENRLAGEEQYWWMQFSSAVEFIKTMEYSE